jgi:outer membrane protein TolC
MRLPRRARPDGPARLHRLAACLLLTALAAGAVAAERPAPLRLDPGAVLQLALAHNADVQYARLQSEVAREGFEAETGLYLPLAYASFRREGRSRPRTVEERLTAALGGIARLEESGRSGELGLRVRTPSGGEASLGWRSAQKRSNVIDSATFSPSDSESNAALVMTVRQPLMRGAGRDVVETDLRVAEAEREVGRWQYRQQLLRVASDALSAYWQLQRATAAQGLRRQALDNALELREDTRVRIAGGRLAPAAIDEAQVAVATREAEIARGAQAVAEAEARLRVLLDLPPEDGGWALVAPAPADPAPADEGLPGAARRLPDALAAWPPLRVAQWRRVQAEHRLKLADDRTLPALDLSLSVSSNALEYGPMTAATRALEGRNPDWSIGFSLEVPIGGDPRAKAQQRAQQLRLQQAELEIRSVQQALASDLYNRVAQLDALRREQAQTLLDRNARRELLAAEEAQYAVGSAPLNRLLRRQADVLDAELRLADGTARVALAQIALQLADGTLLAAHRVEFED